MYRDDPEDSIQDEFESLVFKGHPMGMNILGTEATVSVFTTKDFRSFVGEHIDTRKVVFGFVGNINEHEVATLSKRFLEPIRSKRSTRRRKQFDSYKAKEPVLHRQVKQSRCVIGRDALPIRHQDRIPFYMLTNFLGGPGLNSRLNYLLREKRGMVYSVDAQYVPFSDTGLFGIYFGTEPRQLTKCINIIEGELSRIADEGVGSRQLISLKEQIKGHMALSEESNLSLLLMMGRSLLDFGKVPALEEVYSRVEDTTSEKLQRLARKYFRKGDLSYLIMEPGSNGHSTMN